MVKEEKNMPDWKKRVPYEKSEAATHEKHREPARPVKEAAKAPEKKAVAPVRRAVEEKKAMKEAVPERMGARREAVCDACGKVHTETTRCEIFEYAGEKFHICGECIPPVHENPADFLAGKKGTTPQSEDFDICGPTTRSMK